MLLTSLLAVTILEWPTVEKDFPHKLQNGMKWMKNVQMNECKRNKEKQQQEKLDFWVVKSTILPLHIFRPFHRSPSYIPRTGSTYFSPSSKADIYDVSQNIEHYVLLVLK